MKQPKLSTYSKWPESPINSFLTKNCLSSLHFGLFCKVLISDLQYNFNAMCHMWKIWSNTISCFLLTQFDLGINIFPISLSTNQSYFNPTEYVDLIQRSYLHKSPDFFSLSTEKKHKLFTIHIFFHFSICEANFWRISEIFRESLTFLMHFRNFSSKSEIFCAF